MFGQKVEVVVSNRVFTSDDIDIEFEVPFDDNSEPDVCELMLYNVSPDTIHTFRKGMEVAINAGYGNEKGVIASGQIAYRETEKRGIDRVLLVEFATGASNWMDRRIMRTFGEGVTAKQVLQSLTNDLGIPINELNLGRDFVYKNGLTLTGTVAESLIQVTNNTGSALFIKNNTLTITQIGEGFQTGFVLSADTGLLGSPEVAEVNEQDGYKVDCLLNHRITTGSIIKIVSRDVNGIFRVVRGRHRSNFTTEMEVLPYDG